MDLKQIQYFLRAAEIGHITKAAESLYITQSSLSKAINRLEDSLDCKLFERDGRNVRLSEMGRVVKWYAEKFAFLQLEMESQLADIKTGAAGEVRIGSSFPGREPGPLMQAVTSFVEGNPDVGFHMYQMQPAALESSLKRHDIDLAISSAPVSGVEIVWKELFKEKMGIILSADHPLAQKESVSMRDLERERFYCNNANSDINDLTIQFARAAGFEPIIHFEAELPEYIGSAIAQSRGVSILSAGGFLSSAQLQPREKIVFRPLQESFCYRICGLAYLYNHYHNKAFQNFLHFLSAAFCMEEGELIVR